MVKVVAALAVVVKTVASVDVKVTAVVVVDVVVVAGLKTWDSLPNERDLSWELIQGNLAESPQPRIKRVLELWCCTAVHEDRMHRFWCFFIPHPSARSFGAAVDWVKWSNEAFKAIDFHSQGS